MARKLYATAVAAPSNPLLMEHKTAQKSWGPLVENLLPSPVLTDDPTTMVPSFFLEDICTYARGFKSRGEELFRVRYLEPLFSYFSKELPNVVWSMDAAGNYTVVVNGGNHVLFAGHYDSVHAEDCSPYQKTKLDKDILSLAPVLKNSVPVIKEGKRWIEDVSHDYHYVDYVLPADKRRSLGSDDGTGIALMLFLILNQVQGTYLFTRAEEAGCLGIKYAVENATLDFSKFTIAIEVDRKGTDEVICEMGVGKTASQSFGKALATALGMKHHTNGRGTVTDIAHVADVVAECVNISAGYDLNHSERETCDILYVDRLGLSLVDIDWDALVIERVPGDFKTDKSEKKFRGYSYGYDSGLGDYSSTSTYKTMRNPYGDYVNDPATVHTKFKAMKPGQLETFVRANACFLAEFLGTLDASPAELAEYLNPTTAHSSDMP